MTDNMGVFVGGSNKKHISRKEIEAMKKNMKKVPEIQLKSDIYHSYDVKEADVLLGNISSGKTEKPTSGDHTTAYIHTQKHIGIPSLLRSLRQRFISLSWIHHHDK